MQNLLPQAYQGSIQYLTPLAISNTGTDTTTGSSNNRVWILCYASVMETSGSGTPTWTDETLLFNVDATIPAGNIATSGTGTSSGTTPPPSISIARLPSGVYFPTTLNINQNAAIAGIGIANAPGTGHALVFFPIQLVNKADPTIRNRANGNDAPVSFMQSGSDTNINCVAWIAGNDPSNNNAPRMPQLQAMVGGTNGLSGVTVCWKLKVVFHDSNGDPYRDFDTSTTLTGAQVNKLTNIYENGAVGYSDDIVVPAQTQGSSDPDDGWWKITDGSPCNIYLDPDWQAAVARGFFGGDAVLSVKIESSDGSTTIMPQQDYKFRIAGENPDPGLCESYINSTYNGPTPNWTGLTYSPGTTPPTVPGYWFAYAMAKEETDGDGGRTYYNNFMDNGGQLSQKKQPWPGHEGRPDWNNDGSSANGTGGYGLFQLTFDSTDPNFIMPRDWIWNWQTNVKELLPIEKQKLGYTQGYLNYIHANNVSFTDPSSRTTTADTTTFNFWESSVITLNNGASPAATINLPNGHKRVGAWVFTPASGSTPASWTYVPNPQNYLYKVATKGVENHP